MRLLLKDDLLFCVSDSLETISTWTALEQEDWFEKELPFLRRICRRDWNVIDVGA
ncbi:MAG: hypothetical protein QG638_2158, partial [Pseudomonadota bacterium]|nr:hypothetical protein [Pseudomonadota bacterium]